MQIRQVMNRKITGSALANAAALRHNGWASG